MKIKDLGEIKLIKRLTRQFRMDKSVIKGPGDDAAVIKWTKDKYLLFACDMVVEDVHFNLKTASPFQIGWKALGRNISDIAAMGGNARYALVSLGINPALNISIPDGISRGLKKIADKFGISIVGGDTSKSDKIIVDVAVIGDADKEQLVLRNGAKKGDVIVVTGSFGGSIKKKHLKFIPRINEARLLVKNFKINSMIDVSDSLALDLHRILEASKKGATISEDAIPVSKDAATLKEALFDGEDYELLFTMSKQEARRFFITSYRMMKTPVSIIGEITDKKKGFKIVDSSGKIKSLKIKGYTHF